MRHIWSYEQGNHELLRHKASYVDWNLLQDNDVDVYAKNINTAINSIASECMHTQ